ncbi:hypothetical protein [Mucilaginibacter sp. KACC 22063]|uniref:hypothetical protein n=1 Tax=Mucilaginibacter sp. KACC 22063 TaxID=3025666 RepID=UPI0023672C9E|nr:hypothetical protein [Mucilaginibacter sp. KACC 22063]WDF54900.1 hypothetical protein PQ461_18380 [Mucilaginibacter sp. KACC 22063]
MKNLKYGQPRLCSITADHKHFTDVKGLHPIPSNSIIDKTITGFGATYSEISYLGRNSIIVMSNIALVKAKEQLHKKEFNVFAVWGGVTNRQLKHYIINTGTPKKLLITPEAYKRVKKVITQLKLNLFDDFFILIDESHKLTKDVHYRNRIVEPMNDFFQFKGKAMISATPLLPSDPRFVEHQFQLLKVDPKYDYRKPLRIIHVSNIISALKRYFKDNSDRQYFIFFTSITGIKSIVETLDIKNESNIFCSLESAARLHSDGYRQAYSELTDFNKYNFLTSSYYNGLDIVPLTPADVILISDGSADHTMIDPLTDSVQIIGRFRSGYSKATHFYTTNWKVNALDDKAIDTWINVHCKIYETLRTLKLANPRTSHDQLHNQILEQASNRYAEFVTDNQLDHFKIDNFVNEQRVKGYYKFNDNLIAAYKSNYSAFDLTVLDYVLIPNKQDKLKIRGGKRYSIENNRLVADTLRQLEAFKDRTAYKEAIRHFEQKAPLILQAYHKLGYDKLHELGFKKSLIHRAVIKADFENEINYYPLIDAVQSAFTLNVFYPATIKIKPLLAAIYRDFEIDLVAEARHIKYFFYCVYITKRVDKKPTKGYILIRPKQQAYPDYQRN